MPKLVIMPPQNDTTRRYAERLRSALPEYQVATPASDAEARHEIADADAAYGWVSPELLPLAKRLRWLQSPHVAPPTGYYYPALVEHPLIVSNPRGIFNDHIGQHIMMFVLALARGLPFYFAAQAQQHWNPHARTSPYIDLANATALIVGVGGIGQEAARLCAAFGMRVIGIDARWEHDPPGIERYPPEALDPQLPRADFVIVTIPHTPATEGMWNAQRFRLMKRSAYFINVGRGKTTRLNDLADAIESGQIGGCGLDVFEIEPLPPEHKLWKLPNVLLTPHIAAEDAENIPERRFEILLDNARRFAAGAPLRNIVDKAAWY
jgi:phosphoglycerate dehydrogenase-like enzyme